MREMKTDGVLGFAFKIIPVFVLLKETIFRVLINTLDDKLIITLPLVLVGISHYETTMRGISKHN